MYQPCSVKKMLFSFWKPKRKSLLSVVVGKPILYQKEGGWARNITVINVNQSNKRKDLLAAHIKNDCLQPIPQFICEKCHEGYFSERAVREHYYKIHVQKDLYHCKQCNKGFAHLSRMSSHKDKCPNKGEADIIIQEDYL